MRSVSTTLALVFGIATAAGPRGASAQSPAPKLVVMLMVDQMRADYLDRYGAALDGGLKRLTSSGAWYTHAALPYMNTVTCAGHSTASTGTFPYQHGMINNAWISRATESSETCTEDPDTKLVGYGRLGGPGESAKRLLRPTLAETLRKTRGGRTVALSLKARSAIGLAGHTGDVVIWFDERAGVFTSSTAFTRAPEPSIAAFINAHPIDAARGTAWTRTLPASRYQYDDEPAGERATAGWGMAFPHPFSGQDATFYERWETSPLSDEYLEQMAEAAVDGMHLGSGAAPDFLGVSFSALDLVGHAFGPRSHEVQDVIVRLDRTIGRLIAFLDQRLGPDGYVLALSSDHGVSDIPEQVNGVRLAPELVVRAIEEALRETLADAPPRSVEEVVRPFTGGGTYVMGIANNDVYLRAGVYERLTRQPKAMAAVVDGLGRIPAIVRVLRGDALGTAAARSSSDPFLRAAALSYVPGQSGDLVLVLDDNALMSTSAANHGTARDYDQQIPLIFYGSGVRAGQYEADASSADLAVTLAARLGLALPGVDGHVLTAVFGSSGS